MKENKAKPFFVVGNSRSGTKMISNIIISNSNVSGIQNEFHGGIVESNILGNSPRLFGPLSNRDNFIAFVESFAATDFFILTGLDKDTLYEFRRGDYYDFLSYVMELLAKKNNTDFWLQKTHPFALTELTSHFKEARLVFIERNDIDVMKSTISPLRSRTKHPKIFLFKSLFMYHFGLKQMNLFRKLDTVISITYERLVANKKDVAREVCRHLGVDFNEDMLAENFHRNTSFENDDQRKRSLYRHELAMIKILSPLFGITPLFLYKCCYKIFSFLKSRKAPFVSATYSIRCKEKNIKNS